MGTPQKSSFIPRACAVLALAAVVACGGGTTDDGRADNGRRRVVQRNVRFRTSDGITLTGRLFGTGRVGVLFMHMIPADASSWYRTAQSVARDGYLALAFNFRGYADAEGTKSTTQAPVDIRAARDLLAQMGARTFAFVGASTGGTAAIVAAERLDPLALVVVSAPLRFRGLDAVLSAGRLQRPVLLLASRDDDPAMESLEMFSRALPNPDTKVFNGNAHGTDLLTAQPEAVEALAAFLRRYAPPVQPTPQR